jgi:hypothetical protein
MQDDQECAGHQRNHFEEAVDLLLEWRHLAVLHREIDVPQRGRFVSQERDYQ